MSSGERHEELSETTAGHSDSDIAKLVPVGESIRYRRRAQTAEKEAEILAEALVHARSEASRLTEQLNNIQLEKKLTEKLAAAGTIDPAGAVLIARAGMEGADEMDLDRVVEQLKKEKQYLFGGETVKAMSAQKTAPAKDRVVNNRTVLERAAKKAATTGGRADLQEYLRLRRNFV